ncbi:uncharacterized protein CANTADRAFT_267204 [Suhomyces tanzawaensis NRRL Y-17324]|uniref:Uncharacterized protein n=1 Tax=Suhomyces tanzawaensis NRRL Y-17324 TaxID=984487 RepID=A0A1E4SG75_9ASCO|nr:uncharacterized protein CANTADRAFT_267204 [Suhomyces tanzawaensis NRRL Y-17324]ODV78470.1 hypothetical protein CANTADRAFT_267204 [Suhomyces tanzawaensis NRRL Y-17324]
MPCGSVELPVMATYQSADWILGEKLDKCRMPIYMRQYCSSFCVRIHKLPVEVRQDESLIVVSSRVGTPGRRLSRNSIVVEEIVISLKVNDS